MNIMALSQVPWNKVFAGTIAVITAGYIGFLRFDNAQLEVKVESQAVTIGKLEMRVEGKQLEIDNLTKAISQQNKMVDDWKRAVAEKDAAAALAREHLAKALEDRQQSLDKLRQASPVSCEEGVALIDGALGL